MLYLAMISVILTTLMLFSKSIWDKLLSISSLSVKVAVFIIVLAWVLKLNYLVDIGIAYSIVGGAGTLVVVFLLLRSDME